MLQLIYVLCYGRQNSYQMKRLKILICVVSFLLGYLVHSDFIQQTLIIPLRRFVSFDKSYRNILLIYLTVLFNQLCFVLAFLERNNYKVLMPQIVFEGRKFVLYLLFITLQCYLIANNSSEFIFIRLDLDILQIDFLTPTEKLLHIPDLNLINVEFNSFDCFFETSAITTTWPFLSLHNASLFFDSREKIGQKRLIQSHIHSAFILILELTEKSEVVSLVFGPIKKISDRHLNQLGIESLTSKLLYHFIINILLCFTFSQLNSHSSHVIFVIVQFGDK